MSLREEIGSRRVGHLAVERDDVAAPAPERCQRMAVRLTRGHLVPELPAWRLRCTRLEAVRRLVVRWRHGVNPQIAHSAELFDRLLGVIERLAMVAGLVFNLLYPLALQCAGEDRCRPTACLQRRSERLVDRVQIVAVDL